MTEHTNQHGGPRPGSPSFIKFWSFVAAELGPLKLSINCSATHFNNFFELHSAHPEYLKKIIEKSLQISSGKLDQAVNLNNLLDDLGETAFSLRSNGSDDLFDIELLEEIAWLISTHFSHHLSTRLVETNIGTHNTKQKSNARVISMKKHQIKRANKNL